METESKANRQEGGTVLVKPEGLEGDRDSPKGKRRYTLRDEDAPDKENNLSEKKLKIGQLIEIKSTNMVVVANQEWPQLEDE